MRNLVLILLVFSFTGLLAAPVDRDEAESIALEAFTFYSETHHDSVSDALFVKKIEELTFEGVTVLYAVSLSPEGWVLVPADDSYNPVAFLSFEEEFNMNNEAPQSQAAIESYSMKIHKTIVNEEVGKRKAQWDGFVTKDASLKAGSNNSRDLIMSRWNQNCGYNDFCPIESVAGDGSCGRMITGCNATAMAQVMRYHDYPMVGNGSNTYTPPGFSYSLSANFGSTYYDYSAMNYTSGSSAASRLSYHTGVAISSEYGDGLTNAYPSTLDDALKNNFRYHSDATYIRKSSYTDHQWEQTIRNEIENLRPVIYAGWITRNGNTSGHTFIIEGVVGDLFSVNWGWGGADVQVDINAIAAYPDNNVAVIYIYPPCDANQTITTNYSSGYRSFIASSWLNATNRITGSAKVELRANTVVRLKTGFYATAAGGARVRINTQGCKNGDINETYPANPSSRATAQATGSITEIETEVNSDVEVLPNPSSGIFTLANVPVGATISITSITGEVLFQITAADETVELDLTNEISGAYLCHIDSEGAAETLKLVKL